MPESFNDLFEAPIGLYDEDGSPGFADEVNTGGKKKGTGIRMLGDAHGSLQLRECVLLS
ncbi:hypothetical protein QQ045_028321 [Rhodiola kirilowii]